ncbi:MAG: polysaccharide deacetylase family protein [Desulforhopalus sp.]
MPRNILKSSESTKSSRISVSLAEKIGVASLLSAFLLFFVEPFLAAIPLIFFLLLCFVAPFFPRFGFYLPLVSRGIPGMTGISLTFDDGPSPISTPFLLDLLARHKLKATFFVVGEKAARYPELVANILKQGHTIGNHSWNHDYFLMLRSQKIMQDDIHNTQEILKKSGVQPLIFRPPVGITSPLLREVLNREGLIAVTYSCRAFDRGNRSIDNLCQKTLKALKPGDIIMLHDLPAYHEAQSDHWQNELANLLETLAKKYDIVPLEQLIQRPVNIALE